MHITVNTPTSKIGSQLVPRLLNGGAELTVISRHPDKVASLAAQGARIVEGSVADPEVVSAALADSDALFWLSPPDYSTEDPRVLYNRYTDSALAALGSDNPLRVVSISSLGGNLNQGTGPITGLHDMERKFNASLPNVMHLRPSFFMENTFFNISTIAADGAIYMPMPGNLAVPFVATSDIAAVAAERLLDQQWQGQHVRHLLGPEDVSYVTIAQILSDELDRQIDFIEVTPQQAYEGLGQLGFSQPVADSFLEMYEWSRAGLPGHDAVRTTETTTPTTFRQFAREVFKPAYEQAIAQAAAGTQ
jgi:uncharacterized protein YbjT (DUF2867 family)